MIEVSYLWVTFLLPCYTGVSGKMASNMKVEIAIIYSNTAKMANRSVSFVSSTALKFFWLKQFSIRFATYEKLRRGLCSHSPASNFYCSSNRHKILSCFQMKLSLLSYYSIIYFRLIRFVDSGYRIRRLYLCRGVKHNPTSVLFMTLNCFWLWGLSSEALRNVEYSFHYSQVHSDSNC